MTFKERVAALGHLHLSRIHTEFVVVVALHGGYFLRRQYDRFTGRRRGHLVADFLARLTATRLATRRRLGQNGGHVYHLQSKAIYGPIQQLDHRHRREVSPAALARKIMLLDYVLAAAPRDWYATEQDKVELFTTRFQVAPRDLPSRIYVQLTTRGPQAAGPRWSRHRRDTTRYFIQKQPISVRPETDEVQFAYLINDLSGAGFRSFLQDHEVLLRQLPRWAVIAICPRHLDGLRSSRRVFSEFQSRITAPPSTPKLPVGVDDIRWFFRAKEFVDRGDLKPLSVPDLNRFRDLRGQLTVPAVERLFARWQHEGDAALRPEAIEPAAIYKPACAGRLIEYQLPWNYRAFGTLAGIV